MHGLALETSGRVGSVALMREGDVLVEQSYPHGLQHAAAIVPLIDDLCRQHGLKPRDLAELYVSIGPGSFTGLRVGVTLAKTLAFATGAKVVAVPTLDVLVENLRDAANAIVVLDAKRGQIFTARYTLTRDEWTQQEPAHLDTLAAMLGRSPRPVHLIGDGLPFHRAAIEYAQDVIPTDESLWQARAAVVGRLGHRRARAGTFADVFTLSPVYVRLPEAEEKRLIAEGKLAADGRPIEGRLM